MLTRNHDEQRSEQRISPAKTKAKLAPASSSLATRIASLELERRYAERRRDWPQAERLTGEISNLRARLRASLSPRAVS